MNLFDSANYPTTEPAQLVAGDRWAWKRTDLGVDYPPASYSLRYSARLEGATGAEIEIVATEVGADYIVEVPIAATGTYAPGRYRWQAYILRTSDGERVTVGTGIFEVVANRETSSADPRSHARKVLEAIEAVIEKRATIDQMNFTVTTGSGSRSLGRIPIPDLLVLRDRYRQEAANEDDIAKVAAGLDSSRNIGIRFNRV